MMKNPTFRRISVFLVIISLPLVVVSELNLTNSENIYPTDAKRQNVTSFINSTYNFYDPKNPDGNISILLALDSQLIGEEKFFANSVEATNMFEYWLIPFETKFNISFHVNGFTTFTPGENDSLDISIEKVANDIGWNFATGYDDPDVNGNDYDILVIFQMNYNEGRNRANAVKGNTLIIAHNQPASWTSRQLILLHEVGHIFGGKHDSEGQVPNDWYGSAEYSIMDYEDLGYMHFFGWDKENMPIDDHNFDLINASRYRFDQNDADLDSLPNYYEYRYGLNPNSDDALFDADDDGLNNGDEFLAGTNPLNIDTDEDSFSDWAENLYHSSPINITDIPIITEPVIFSWLENQSIFQNESINLKWRAVASFPNKYAIYQNGSLLVEDEWTQELIQLELTELTPGYWEFNCIVEDNEGQTAQAIIKLEVLKVEKTAQLIEFYFPGLFLFSFFVFYSLNKRRQE